MRGKSRCKQGQLYIWLCMSVDAQKNQLKNSQFQFTQILVLNSISSFNNFSSFQCENYCDKLFSISTKVEVPPIINSKKIVFYSHMITLVWTKFVKIWFETLSTTRHSFKFFLIKIATNCKSCVHLAYPEYCYINWCWVCILHQTYPPCYYKLNLNLIYAYPPCKTN